MEQDCLESFRNAFEQYAESNLLPQHLEPRLEISGQLSFAEITEKFIRQTRLFGPFGPGNMEPVWVAKNVEVRDLRILKEAHVRLFLAQAGVQFEAIGFGLARSLGIGVAQAEGLERGVRVSGVGEPPPGQVTQRRDGPLVAHPGPPYRVGR